MGKIKVLGGSFKEQKSEYSSGEISLLDENDSIWNFGKPINIKSKFETIEIVTDTNKVNFLGAAGWGAVGTILAGPFGFAAGAILGGRGKQVTFVARLKDGRQFVGQTDPKTYGKMLADLLA